MNRKRFHRKRRRGALTLEWIVLITVICIGIIGGLGAVRNALIREFAELTESICNTDIGP